LGFLASRCDAAGILETAQRQVVNGVAVLKILSKTKLKLYSFFSMLAMAGGKKQGIAADTVSDKAY
jgi:hypothetical protein